MAICPFCGLVEVKKEELDGYEITRCSVCSAILKKTPLPPAKNEQAQPAN